MNRRLHYAFFLIFFFISVPNITVSAKNIVNVRDFGAVPDDGKDDTKALRKAAAYCRENPGTQLVIPPGVYRLKDKDAEALEQKAMSGKFGNKIQDSIYRPYRPYVKGLDFSGAEDLSISAEGAKLMCEGWMEPISFVNCRNVELSGLSIDYKRQPYSYGTITNINDKYFDVRFSDDRRIEETTPFLRATFWMKDKNRLYPHSIYFPKKEILGNNLVRIHHSIPGELNGTIFGVIHSFHFRPAVLLLESENILLRDVTIHSQPGMGIVGFDSKDITLQQVAIVPAPGKYFSTNTDATHFACCEGLLRLDGCRFQAQGDDATNVHGYYQTITKASGNKATIKVMAETFTHAQVLDKPNTGDILELVEISTLKPVRNYTVKDVVPRETDFETDVTLSEELPEDFQNYYLSNVTKLPKLEFVNCVVNSHLARGILVKTRDVLVDNNIFMYCTGTAVHVGAEANWHESSHAKDVRISNNVMIGCGSGDGGKGNAAGIAVIIEAKDLEGTYLHENIEIYNNSIVGENTPHGIYISNAKNVKLENNKITDCKEQVRIENSSNVSLID